jgi:hypothetical protein
MMVFAEMQVPLEIQKLALEKRLPEQLGALSITSCHTSSCSSALLKDAESLDPTVKTQ